MAQRASCFIGFVVSVVEEFVTNAGERLPGSCAAVWGLQPERGGEGEPITGPWDCPHVLGEQEKGCSVDNTSRSKQGSKVPLQRHARSRILSGQNSVG